MNAQRQVRPTTELISYFLQLEAIPNIGYAKLQKLANALQCPLSSLPKCAFSSLINYGLTPEQASAMTQPSQTIAAKLNATEKWLDEEESHHFITLDCESYPFLLKEISRPPLFLYVKGDLTSLNKDKVAFVGTRKPSLGAVHNTQNFIQQLQESTNAISISGMALGIDAIVHQASIANNLPTIGVLGCSIDHIYPKRHKNLYKNVSENGALISEFVIGTAPKPVHFPRRNRIISGLALGTVVMEARVKSGSLVTAKYAAQQNREVFAVPSHINNEESKGCHMLIKDGAKLTENIADIIEELPTIALNLKIEQKNSQQSLAFDLLLDSVEYSATSIDIIAKRTGMSLGDLLSKLLEYELRGLVASTAEGYVKLRA